MSAFLMSGVGKKRSRTCEMALTFAFSSDEILQEVDRAGVAVHEVRVAVDGQEDVTFEREMFD